MSESITPSPADSKSYTSGLKADGDPKAARSDAEGISSSPASAKTFVTFHEKGAPLASASESNPSTPRSRIFSTKADTKSRS
jgi:hypothetical protein